MSLLCLAKYLWPTLLLLQKLNIDNLILSSFFSKTSVVLLTKALLSIFTDFSNHSFSPIDWMSPLGVKNPTSTCFIPLTSFFCT